MLDKKNLYTFYNLYGKNKKIILDQQNLTLSDKENIINESVINNELYQKLVLSEFLESKELQSKVYEFGERIASLETELSNIKNNNKNKIESKRFSITTFISIISLIISIILAINIFYPFANQQNKSASQTIQIPL